MKPVKLNWVAATRNSMGTTTLICSRKNPEHRVDLTAFPWPFADKSVDAVAMLHFLEHVEDLERTILEVHRILKLGGEFWCLFRTRSIRRRMIFLTETISLLHFPYDRRASLLPVWREKVIPTTFFKMPLVSWRWLKWTPLDVISSRFPVFYEKFIPFAPANIEWKGIAV